MTTEFWDDRYQQIDYVYGTRPNTFFREKLDPLPPGRLLLPGEGEGRNAVYAAHMGWQVDAFDISKEGQRKALQLAQNVGASISYSISNYEDMVLENEVYDACGLIYTHAAPHIRKALHQKVIYSLKPGGLIIMEVFSKNQINNESGGPKNPEMLSDLDDLIQNDFADMAIVYSKEEVVDLDEGAFHKGRADVIRLVAVKQ